ncbi:nucleoside deaminase [Candidatus Dependentiae bacterium]|nr:nucleoside deaminase [Candidatus Dependentiae bacterium]
MREQKEFFMGKALKQAVVALKYDEVPIGSVVVSKEGTIIGRGYNRMETAQCQLAHAEARAIAQACKKIGGWRLNGCTIYVTLEPCLMCIGLIQLSRVDAIVYGAPSPLFGSIINGLTLPTYAKQLRIECGIREQECVALLQSFFKTVRKKRKDRSERQS